MTGPYVDCGTCGTEKVPPGCAQCTTCEVAERVTAEAERRIAQAEADLRAAIDDRDLLAGTLANAMEQVAALNGVELENERLRAEVEAMRLPTQQGGTVKDALLRQTVNLIATWIAKRDFEFSAELAALRKSHERCRLYPACRKTGGCSEHAVPKAKP